MRHCAASTPYLSPPPVGAEATAFSNGLLELRCTPGEGCYTEKPLASLAGALPAWGRILRPKPLVGGSGLPRCSETVERVL